MGGYYGIIDWTGLPCGTIAAVVPAATGQVFCLHAFDGKSFSLEALDEECND